MKKYIPIILTAFLWIWPAIAITILSKYFDLFTQNFYRFLAAGIVLVLINLIGCRQSFLRELTDIRKFIFPSLLLFSFQVCWVRGITLLAPALAILIHRTHILFVTGLSFIFFKDERKIIASRAFIFGVLLSIAGLAGVATAKSGVQMEQFNSGALFMLLAALLWAFYTITIKTIVRETNPLAAAGIIYTLTVPLFFAGSLLFGDVTRITAAPPLINALLFVSGIFCVGVANAFNFTSIKLIGAVISSIVVLITPFFIAVASYFIFREVLTPQQIVSGLVLIAGCALLVMARERISRFEDKF